MVGGTCWVRQLAVYTWAKEWLITTMVTTSIIIMQHRPHATRAVRRGLLWCLSILLVPGRTYWCPRIWVTLIGRGSRTSRNTKKIINGMELKIKNKTRSTMQGTTINTVHKYLFCTARICAAWSYARHHTIIAPTSTPGALSAARSYVFSYNLSCHVLVAVPGSAMNGWQH